MKKIWITGALMIFSFTFSQTGVVGVNTVNPNNKSVLEVYSKTTGVLLPRLTTIQRDAIILSPDINGLIIYNTDDKCFNFYRSTLNVWEKMCGEPVNTTAKNTNSK